MGRFNPQPPVNSNPGNPSSSSDSVDIYLRENSRFKILPEIAREYFKKKFHLSGPLAPKPLVQNRPKSVRYNYIHPSACLQKFVPIAQYLQEVMPRRTHSPRSGRKRKRRKCQNNFLESHVWSRISGKPVERKI